VAFSADAIVTVVGSLALTARVEDSRAGLGMAEVTDEADRVRPCWQRPVCSP
jgi:hypothetical protein